MASQIPSDRIPPTTAAYVVASAIVAGVTGYFIGQGASLGLFSSSSSSKKKKKTTAIEPPRTPRDNDGDASDEEEDDDESEEDSDDGDGGELASFNDSTEEVKLVLVVRTDLGMTKGRCPF